MRIDSRAIITHDTHAHISQHSNKNKKMATILDDIKTKEGDSIKVKRLEGYKIDPRHITVVDGWNPRTDFEGEDELMASIKEIGVQEPLTVKKTAGKELELIDGERRLRATLRLIEEQGLDDIKVPVFVESAKISEIDLYFKTMAKNTGSKQMSPVEEATGFKRLVAWGVSIKEIAAKTCRSESHVRNRLELANATPAVKEAVTAGEITTTQAVEIVKESGGKVDDQADALLEKQTAPPRPKPLKMFVDDGALLAKGKNAEVCAPLVEFIESHELRVALEKLGFNPDSIKISILKK